MSSSIAGVESKIYGEPESFAVFLADLRSAYQYSPIRDKTLNYSAKIARGFVMVKLTKNQRRKNKRNKLSEKAKRRKARKRATQAPWVAPTMQLFPLPNILPPDMAREQRIEVIRNIGQSASEEFHRRYPAIATWFERYDGLYILSYCAFYLCSYREGTDPELNEKFFPPHYLEILQAFALAQHRSPEIRPLQDQAVQLENDMREIGKAMQLRLLDFPEDISHDDNSLNAFHLRTEMMSHTTAIRNWAYAHQMQRVVFDLAARISKPFQALYGIRPETLFRLLFALTEERSDLLNKHRGKLYEAIKHHDYSKMIDAYNRAFPENTPIEAEAANDIWVMAKKKKSGLRAMLIAHADLKLKDVYSFTLEHACSILGNEVSVTELSAILESLSFAFGDLGDFPREHIILGNPVLSKPFIRVDDTTYFSAIWGVVPHIALDLLEAYVWRDKALMNTYTAAKAQYLEDQIEDMFRKAFPNGVALRGSEWTDCDTGTRYENDLILILESFAIVIEAKSGTVSDPAKRGAPKRLFETLKHLIEEPSEQALRFIRVLDSEKKVHTFSTQRGESNVIDSSKIRYYIPLGVTFSNLDMIGSNLKKLIEARVVEKRLEELAPSISFTDLETVIELLPLELEKIHYLARRREFEAHMQYEGDELDLLSFYLGNGFNIGDTEYDRDLVMHLGLKSKELDSYIIGTAQGRVLRKPRLAMSKWWADLLIAITNKRSDGWVETGFILLNSTKEDQEKFERMFSQLMASVREGRAKRRHNWLMFSTGPVRRRYLIAGYPYTTTDSDLRDAIVNEIIADNNFGTARGAVVIGVQTDRMDYPYSFLARRATTHLFDELTLAEQRQ